MTTATVTTPAPPARAANGAGRSAERLAQVYAAYWPHTVRVITRQVRQVDRDLAPDLAQRTFLRAWPYLHHAPIQDEARMRRWLATIARHVVAEQYRDHPARQRAAETLVDPAAALWDSTPSAPAHGVGDEPAGVVARVDLAAALERLPEDTRQILRLRILEDLPVAEVARRVGRERSAVIRHTTAGLAALRTHLSDDSGADSGELVDPARQPVAAGTRHAPERRTLARTVSRTPDQTQVAPPALQAQHLADGRTGRGEQRWHQHRGRCPLGVSLAEYVRRLDEPAPATRSHRGARANPAAAGMTLRDYGATRLASAMRGLAPGTAAPYLAGWRQRVVPTLGDLPVSSIDPAAVQRAVASWTAEGAGRSTVKNTRAVLAHMLDQAVRDGVLDTNPATPAQRRPSIAARATTTAGHTGERNGLSPADRPQLAALPDDPDARVGLGDGYPPDGLAAVPRVEPAGVDSATSMTPEPASDWLTTAREGPGDGARQRMLTRCRSPVNDGAALGPRDAAAELDGPAARDHPSCVDDLHDLLSAEDTEDTTTPAAAHDRVLDEGEPPPGAPTETRRHRLAPTASATTSSARPVDQSALAQGDADHELAGACHIPDRHALASGRSLSRRRDAADNCAADTTPVEHVKAAGGEPDSPPGEQTAAAVARARAALARLREDRAAERRAGERARAEQLARWHTTDQAAEHGADNRAVGNQAAEDCAVGEPAPVAGRCGEPAEVTR